MAVRSLKTERAEKAASEPSGVRTAWEEPLRSS